MPKSPEDRNSEGTDSYLKAWSTLNRFLDRGKSFSGHERNCVFLNVHGSRFADVSAISGLDFPDDGRSIGLVDWDRDGRLDMWLTNRTGPRLRLMRNCDPSDNQFVTIKLRGTTCNRDAIGARVEVHLEGAVASKLVETLRAGEGYLSQSTKWLHFGLGRDARIKHVRVYWPDGRWETFHGVQPRNRYLLVQGGATPLEQSRPTTAVELASSTQQAITDSPGETRVVLPNPVPCPELHYAHWDVEEPVKVQSNSKPMLLNLWASWCSPCLEEIGQYSQSEQQLRSAGLELLCLSVDGLGQEGDTNSGRANPQALLQGLRFPFASGIATAQLVRKLQILQDVLLDTSLPPVVPSSFLIDGQGRMRVIYRGSVGVEQLLQDAANLDASPTRIREMSVPFAGRWFGPTGGIDVRKLAVEFQKEFPQDALMYLRMGLEQLAARRDEAAREHPGGLGGLPPKDARRDPQRLGGQAPQTPRVESQPFLKRRLDENEAALYLRLALLQNRMGRPPEAFQSAIAGLRLRPQDVQLNIAAAEALRDQGSLTEAVDYYLRAIDEAPERYQTRRNVAQLLRKEGRVHEAIDQLKAAVAIRANFAAAHFDLAMAHGAVGNYGEASLSFERVLSIEPKHLGALTNLGAALERMGKSDAAEGRYRAALLIDPDYPNAHLLLATLLRTTGRLKEALKHDEQYLLLRPNSARGYYGHGMTLQLAGRTFEAIEQYGRSLQIAPDLHEAANRLAWVLATDSDPTIRNGPEAVRLATQACVATENKNPSLLATLATAQAEIGQFDEAVTTAKMAIACASVEGYQHLEVRLREMLQRVEAGKRIQQNSRKLRVSPIP